MIFQLILNFSFHYNSKNPCLRYLLAVYRMYGRLMSSRMYGRLMSRREKCNQRILQVLDERVLYIWIWSCGSYSIVLSTNPSNHSKHHVLQWEEFSCKVTLLIIEISSKTMNINVNLYIRLFLKLGQRLILFTIWSMMFWNHQKILIMVMRMRKGSRIKTN